MVVLDYSLPDRDGLDVLKDIRTRHGDVPVVFLTSADSAEICAKALKGGAAYSYLPASVRRFPGPRDLAELIARAGFDGVEYRTFAGGIVALHTGTKR